MKAKTLLQNKKKNTPSNWNKIAPFYEQKGLTKPIL